MCTISLRRKNRFSRWMRINSRSCEGSELAEFGPTLFIVFVMLLFPLIALGTLALRYSLFAYAARLAASAGAKCTTFKIDANPPRDCSAVNIASAIANQTVSGFSGITLSKIDCYIVTSPLGAGAVQRQTTPLAIAADTNTGSYAFEVVLRGQVSPLITNPNSWFFNIPGLSAPITTSVSADAFVENTQGLTL